MDMYLTIIGIAFVVSAFHSAIIRHLPLAIAASFLVSEIVVFWWWVRGCDEPRMFVLPGFVGTSTMLIVPTSMITVVLVHIARARWMDRRRKHGNGPGFGNP